MGLASAILIIVAGLIYVVAKYEQEHGGTILFVLVIGGGTWLSIYVIPAVLAEIQYRHRVFGTILIVLYFIVFIAGWIYLIFFAPKKWGQEEMTDEMEIWKEVNALPEPTEEELLQYRAKLGLPTYPRDSKMYNSAARDAWRREQYNIRYKERHKFVTYL